MNDSKTLLLWIIAGVTTLIFGILSIALERNLGYLVRKLFEPAKRVGKEPAKKSAYLWITWATLGLISIFSVAVASFKQNDIPTEAIINSTLSIPTEVIINNTPSIPTHVSPDQKIENLAPNPSFEQGALQPAGWSWSNMNAEYTWNREIAHTNKRSICIGHVRENISAQWSTSIWITVDAGRSYNFSVWARGDIDRDVYLGIAPLNADGEWLTGYAELLSFNQSTWTKTEGEYAIPYMGSYVVLSLEVNNPDGFTDGFVCFDDIVFEPIASLP